MRIRDGEPRECRRTAEQVAAFLDTEPGWPGLAGFIEHARNCGTCAETLRLLQDEPAPGGSLENRLLAVFREWRDQPLP